MDLSKTFTKEISTMRNEFYEDVRTRLGKFQTVIGNRVSEYYSSSSMIASLLESLSKNQATIWNVEAPLPSGVLRGKYAKELYGDSSMKGNVFALTYYDDVFDRIGAHPTVIDFEAEIARRKEEARKNAANKPRQSRGGIFNYEVFYGGYSSQKCSLSSILDDPKHAGLTPVWAVASGRHVGAIQSAFKSMHESAKKLGIDIPHFLVVTCESVWKANAKRFPNADQLFNDLRIKTYAKIEKKLKSIVQYDEASNYALDYAAESLEKTGLPKTHRLVAFIDELVKNRKLVASLSWDIRKNITIATKSIFDIHPEYKTIKDDYELAFVRDFYMIRNEPEAVGRYVQAIDSMKSAKI